MTFKMAFKKIWIIVFLVFSLIPTQKTFAESSNTGFVKGDIWYSKDPFEEGDKIKIYTFLFNPDEREFSGTVIFFDKTTLLGKKDFNIIGKGAKDISIDWTVTLGDHSIFAKIENAKYLISRNVYEDVYIAQNETQKSSRSVSKKLDISTEVLTPENIKQTIEDNIPSSFAKPINSTLDTIENFRTNTNITSENKKDEIKKEIDNLNKNETVAKTKTIPSPFLKPFKYVELFILTIFSFILNNKILFYGILLFILGYILYYIWNKIF